MRGGIELEKNNNDNFEKVKEIKKSKMKIPVNVQRDMLDFFMRTSIPRKKLLEKLDKNNHLPTEEKGG